MFKKLIPTLSRNCKRSIFLMTPFCSYSAFIGNENKTNEEKRFNLKIISTRPLTKEHKEQIENRTAIIKLGAFEQILDDIIKVVKTIDKSLFEDSINKDVETNTKSKFVISTDESTKEQNIIKIDISDTSDVQSDNTYYEIIFNNKKFCQVFFVLSKDILDPTFMEKSLIKYESDRIKIYILCKNIDTYIEAFYKFSSSRFTHEATYSSEGVASTTFVWK